MSRKHNEIAAPICASRLKSFRKFAATFLLAGLLQAGMQVGIADPLPLFPPTMPTLEPDDASIDYSYHATGKVMPAFDVTGASAQMHHEVTERVIHNKTNSTVEATEHIAYGRFITEVPFTCWPDPPFYSSLTVKECLTTNGVTIGTCNTEEESDAAEWYFDYTDFGQRKAWHSGGYGNWNVKYCLTWTNQPPVTTTIPGGYTSTSVSYWVLYENLCMADFGRNFVSRGGFYEISLHITPTNGAALPTDSTEMSLIGIPAVTVQPATDVATNNPTLSNGSFESGLSGWSAGGGIDVVGSGAGMDNSYAAKFGATNGGWLSQSFTLPAANYNLSFKHVSVDGPTRLLVVVSDRDSILATKEVYQDSFTSNSLPFGAPFQKSQSVMFSVTNGTLIDVTILDLTHNFATNKAVVDGFAIASTPLMLSGCFNTNLNFELSITNSGELEIVASSNLVDWTTIGSVSAPSTFVDTNSAGLTNRFYRLQDGSQSSAAFGFVRVVVPPTNSVLAADQLINSTSNTVKFIFESWPVPPPSGTVVQKWIYGTQSWVTNTFSSGAWSDTNMSIGLGEGMAIVNNSNQPITIAFTGYVPEGSFSLSIPHGLSMISSFVPQAGQVSSVLQCPIGEFDSLYQQYVAPYGGGLYTFLRHNLYIDGGWDGDDGGQEPTVRLGEAFWFLNNSSSNTWTRNFTLP